MGMPDYWHMPLLNMHGHLKSLICANITLKNGIFDQTKEVVLLFFFF